MHPFKHKTKRPGTRRPLNQASLGVAGLRAGAAPTKQKRQARGHSCPDARRSQRQRTTAAPAGRLDSGNRRPAGLPAESSTWTNKQPKKLFETLAARPDAASLAQAAQKDSDHCGA